MTGLEFMALAAITFGAVAEVVTLASEHGPAIVDQVRGWF
jgi:hypothetical protein|tara:strand:- start:10181 stop:10300 length:120 start_codon:yes stop_codon:yes gene_type:complete